MELQYYIKLIAINVIYLLIFELFFLWKEEKAMEEGIPEFLKNSIILQTFGVTYKHPCQAVENVVIPPYILPESVRDTLKRAPIDGDRDIWVFFRGKMEVHPKNISGRFYSKLRKYSTIKHNSICTNFGALRV